MGEYIDRNKNYLRNTHIGHWASFGWKKYIYIYIDIDSLGEQRILGVGKSIGQIVQRHGRHLARAKVLRRQIVFGLPFGRLVLRVGVGVRLRQVQVVLRIVEDLH